MKIGSGEAPLGERKAGRDMQNKAAKAKGQRFGKNIERGRGAGWSWGTTEGGRQRALEEHGLATVWTQDFVLGG